MTDSLLLEKLSDVLVVRFNRPDKLNAMTSDMESAYLAALAGADSDPETRAIVVTGTGTGFCAGADISTPRDEHGPKLPDRNAAQYPPTMSTPVIAAINGACAGLGFALAIQADVRFVADDAKLTTAFARRGLVAEYGVAWLLPRLVGRGRALDLLLSARSISGTDAHSYGLAEFCLSRDEVVSAAISYAREIAALCSPTAVAAIKQQLVQDDLKNPLGALRSSDDWVNRSYTWPDVREGVTSWQERRTPMFPPLLNG